MRQVITSLFSECVAVASVSVYRLEGGSVGAVVKVNLFLLGYDFVTNPAGYSKIL